MDKQQARRLAILNSHINHPRSDLESFSNVTTSSIDYAPCSATNKTKLLENKVAIITGSGRGLGAAAAKLFAQHGARVVVSDIDADKADQTASSIREAGGEALVVAGDLTAPDFPEKLISATLEAFGAIDIIINNAGYIWDGMLHKISAKQWEAMLAVHCTAPFRVIQAAAPYLRGAAKKEQEEGLPQKDRCILNVSSTSGTHGNIGQANYATAKAGVLGLTKTVAKEWGSLGIRCNTITFGLIATRLTADKDTGESISIGGETIKLGMLGGDSMRDMAAEISIPLRRIGTPDEAAGAMLLLCLPYASFITGQSLEVTGGMYI